MNEIISHTGIFVRNPYGNYVVQYVIELIGMAVLGMFGKLTFPGQKRLQSAKCPKCGRFRIGKGPCQCGHGGRK